MMRPVRALLALNLLMLCGWSLSLRAATFGEALNATALNWSFENYDPMTVGLDTAWLAEAVDAPTLAFVVDDNLPWLHPQLVEKIML